MTQIHRFYTFYDRNSDLEYRDRLLYFEFAVESSCEINDRIQSLLKAIDLYEPETMQANMKQISFFARVVTF